MYKDYRWAKSITSITSGEPKVSPVQRLQVERIPHTKNSGWPKVSPVPRLQVGFSFQHFFLYSTSLNFPRRLYDGSTFCRKQDTVDSGGDQIRVRRASGRNQRPHRGPLERRFVGRRNQEGRPAHLLLGRRQQQPRQHPISQKSQS